MLSQDFNKYSSINQFLIAGLVLANVLALVVSVGYFVSVLDRGFDITDESFYILNAWSPKDNQAALTVFGYYLNIFVDTFGKNIVILRTIGLIGLLSVSGFLAYQLVRYCQIRSQSKTTALELVVIVFAVMAAALVYYRIWLPTPSYNWFSLLGTILVASGGVLALRTRRYNIGSKNDAVTPRKQLINIAFIIGFGGFVGFVGRPTTGLALGVIVGIWLIFTLRLKQLLIVGPASLAIFLLLITAHIWWFDGGWLAMVERIETGLDFATTLQAGQTIPIALERAVTVLLEIPQRFIFGPIGFGYLAIAAVVMVAVLLQKRANIFAAIDFGMVNKVAIFCGYLVFLIAWILQKKTFIIGELPGFFGLDMSLFLWGILIIRVVTKKLGLNWNGTNSSQDTSSRLDVWELHLLIGLFVFLALFHSLGSTSAIINGSGTAFILYVSVASLTILELYPHRYKLARIILLSLIAGPSIYFFFWSADNPYRQPALLSDQNQQITFLGNERSLKVDPATASWVNGLQKIAINAGWQKGLPLIDLTGGTPGASVVLAAKPPVTSWWVGGYKGSIDYAKLALSLSDEKTLNTAWVLTAPKGVRRVPLEVLKSVNIEFPEGYSLVGSVKTGYRNEEQLLWKPN